MLSTRATGFPPRSTSRSIRKSSPFCAAVTTASRHANSSGLRLASHSIASPKLIASPLAPSADEEEEIVSGTAASSSSSFVSAFSFFLFFLEARDPLLLL